MRPIESGHYQTRRNFIRAQAGGVAAVLATGTTIAPRRLTAGTEPTPEAALQELMAGNKRFAAGQMISCKDDLSALRKKTAAKQEPFAAVLSCADSRVPVEFIFDQSIGHIFVTRVAGNVATPEIIASLEYGVAILGTKAILVLGHANCGAVKATIQGEEVPGQISALYSRIQPAVDEAGSNLEAAIKANAELQCGLLSKASTVISSSIRENKLKVIAGYYDLASGCVTLLE